MWLTILTISTYKYNQKSITRDTKLCTKTCTKLLVVIHIAIYSKPCQLKLNEMDCYANYHTGFRINFGI